MPRKKKPWRKKFGGYGYTVVLCEKVPGGNLYLRCYDPEARNWAWKSLRHRDRVVGEMQARKIAADLLAAAEARAKGRVTLSMLFARYETEVSIHKKGSQPREDARRIRLWTHFLGGDTDPHAITKAKLRRFVRLRRAGQIRIPGANLSKSPGETTIGADIVFLQSVLNWGVEAELLEYNPARGFKRPRTPQASRRRPVATWDRFLRVYRHTDRIDRQRLFRPFLMLVQELGWRVSAICALRASDIRRRATEHAPYGEIRKRGAHDKKGVDQWIPLSRRAREAVDLLLRRRPIVGEAWLFPSPRNERKPWRRQHARDLLERAEKRAKLKPLEGGDFHPYRRKWATERKHHPLADVMRAGGWDDPRSLQECYQLADEVATFAVVSEPRKLTGTVPQTIPGVRRQEKGPAAEAATGP
ncbi:MAG TPA: tyrosine-type recombinase/integrase [Longimicrobiales bacterium]|nr:tyrosine-type recombinase/integrase [Longimicrobiales bacterium]